MSVSHLAVFLWVRTAGSPLISKVTKLRNAGCDLHHVSSVTPITWHQDTPPEKLADRLMKKRHLVLSKDANSGKSHRSQGVFWHNPEVYFTLYRVINALFYDDISGVVEV
jgi:hypothetical protein